MNYKELFSAINCRCLVIIEDDFQQIPYNKNRTMYDIVRMNADDQKCFLEKVKEKSDDLHKSLTEFLTVFYDHFNTIQNWNEVIVAGDILSSPLISNNIPLKTNLTDLFIHIDGNLLQENAYHIGARYGIGVDHPSYFDKLYDEYITNENRLQSIRIYTDFISSTESLFEEDIRLASPTQSIVCIIDDYLQTGNYSKEIIDVIKKYCETNCNNIVGSIFSSKTPSDEISEILYFEYTSKDRGNLEASIAKSAYHFFIAELKDETIKGLTQAFKKALENKSIAFFLSKKAYIDGTPEYQVINNWIKLLSIPSHQNPETIKHLIGLSKVINNLEETEDLVDPELQNLNTLEAFDYSINEFYLPIASGDIFKNSKDEWFVLIGQDCDMARRPEKSPRIAVAEFLKTTICNQTNFNKWVKNLSNASIYNFRKSLSDNSSILQVDYTQRFFVPNEIVNLCSFDSNGNCQISLSQELTIEQIRLIPDYMVTYYKQLQRYFKSITSLQNKVNEEFNFIINNSCDNYLTTLNKHEKKDGIISFDLKRVCRLSHNYVCYLYNLYLEYRGRQPFQTINLIRREELSFPVMVNGKATSIYLSFSCIPNPQSNKHKNYPWIVRKSNLDDILEALHQEKTSNLSDEIIINEPTMEISLSNNKKLTFEKRNDKVNLIFN